MKRQPKKVKRCRVPVKAEAAPKKKHPSIVTLLAWFLYDRMSFLQDFVSPESLESMLQDFYRRSKNDMQNEFHRHYKEFRQQFCRNDL